MMRPPSFPSDPMKSALLEEAMTEVIFHRLDPIVKALFTTFQEYQKLQPTATISSSANGQQQHHDDSIPTECLTELKRCNFEKMLSLLKSQAEILHCLEKKIQETASDIICWRDEEVDPQLLPQKSDMFASCLVLLSNYISLPILSILESVRAYEEWNVSTVPIINRNNSTNESRFFRIRQTARRNCVEAAARALTALVMAIKSGGTIFSVDVWKQSICHDSPKRRRIHGATVTTAAPSSSSLDRDKILNALRFCAIALPNVKVIAFTRRNSEKQGLDDVLGEGCCDSLLQTVQSLVIHASLENHLCSNNNDKSLDLTTARILAVMVEIVNVCVEFILPATHRSACQTSTVPSFYLSSSPNFRERAVETLECFFNHVPDVPTWRDLFPGCFKSLYLMLFAELQMSSASSSPKAGAAALRTLVRFLGLTLSRITSAKTRQPFVLESLERFKNLATKSKSLPAAAAAAVSGSSWSFDVPGGDQSTKFFRNVSVHVPVPLTTLLKLLSETRFKLIRQSAPSLCRVLLLDAADCWETNAARHISVAAIECCLILENDSDGNVASSAKEVLSIVETFDMDLIELVTRVQVLMEEIPTLVQCRRENILCGRLKLITGYVDLLGSMAACRSKGGAKRLVSRLADAVSSCRSALSGLFSIDFKSISCSPHSAVLSIVDQSDLEGPMFQFHYMASDSAGSAEVMVQRLGKVLGAKHAAMFIDGCVADTYETISSSIESDSSVSLYELVGLLLLAQYMFTGAFTPRDARTKKCNSGVNSSSNHSRTERKIAASLASSILPLLCSPLFLRLPDNLREDKEQILRSQTDQIIPVGIGHSIQVYVNGESRGVRSGGFPSIASNSRACFSSCVLELLCVILTIFKDNVATFFPVILSPIIEAADTHNHLLVRRQAISVLRRLAIVAGLNGVQDLANQNFDHLIGGLFGRLRVPGGHFPRESNDFRELCSLSRAACFVLRQASEAEKGCSGDSSHMLLVKETQLTLMVQFISTLINRFDRIVVRYNSTEIMTEMVRICGAAMIFLCAIYDVDKLMSISREDHQAELDWKEALASIRRGHTVLGATSLRSDSSIQIDNLSPRKDESITCLVPSKIVIDFVSLTLARCCFALSYPELKVQLEGCECIEDGYRFLAFAARLKRADSDSETRNIVLRQVSDSWPAFIGRFVSVSKSLYEVGSHTTMFARNRAESLTASQTVFLSKLFALVAAMSEASGEFIASRFENDVWPVAASLLGRIIDGHKQICWDASSNSAGTGTSSLLRRERNETSHHFFTTSGRNLQVSILSCFARVFEHRTCGEALSNLIPAIGITILPLLEDDKVVGEMAMKALEAMVRIDSDALWQPLWRLSGRAVRIRALKPKVRQIQSISEELLLLSATRASKLLDDVESRPEQRHERMT